MTALRRRLPGWELFEVRGASDEDLSLVGPLLDPSGRQVAHLFEALDTLAARAPGWEGRAWVAVVAPEGKDPGLVVTRPGAAASLLVVGTPAGVERALDRGPLPVAPRRGRLVIQAHMAADGSAQLQVAARQARAAGLGEPPSDASESLFLSLQDAAGTELLVHPVSVQGTAPPLRGLALPTPPPSTARIELQLGRTALAGALSAQRRMPARWRPAALAQSVAPALAVLTLPQGRLQAAWTRVEELEERSEDGTDLHLRWGTSQEAGAPVWTRVEVGVEESWVTVATARPCQEELRLDRQAWGAAPQGAWRLRLAFTDGWSEVTSVVYAVAPAVGPGLVLRAAGSDRYWADAEDEDAAGAHWVLGRRKQRGPAIEVESELSGTLRLEVRDSQACTERAAPRALPLAWLR